MYIDYKKLRLLFFSGIRDFLIARRCGLPSSFIKRELDKHNLIKKRERYYRYLVNYAYNHGLSIAQIARIKNISSGYLTKVKRKCKIGTIRIDPPNKRITEEIKCQMVSAYELGKASQQIAEEMGYATSKTVLDVLREKNVDRRSPRSSAFYDYDFFRKINSHDKAYILGLLYTDGYVLRDYDGLAIQLTIGDGYVLERIAKRIGASCTVNKIDCSGKRKKMPGALDMMRLNIHSVELARQAKLLGVVRNKTYCLDMTNKLPKKYTYSFLRGAMDGDGTIGTAKTGNIWCKIATKSSKFAHGLEKLPIKEKLFAYFNPCAEIYTVGVVGGNAETIKFLKNLYKDKSDLFLSRKYEKIKNYIC